MVAEDFSRLEADPFGSVGHDVEAVRQCPSGVARAVGEPPSGLLDAGEAGCVARFRAPGGHGADHGSIGLRHDHGGAFSGQFAEVLFVVRLEWFARPPGGLHGRLSHGRGVDCKSVVLFDSLAAFAKGMLGPKVAHRPLQALRFSACADACLRAEDPQVIAARCLPDAFLDGDASVAAPPDQGFFYRCGCRVLRAAIARQPGPPRRRPSPAWRGG